MAHFEIVACLRQQINVFNFDKQIALLIAQADVSITMSFSSSTVSTPAKVWIRYNERRYHNFLQYGWNWAINYAW
jgi:hypothetical protein